jgi:hypothetical protein
MSINWSEYERPSGGDYLRWKPETEGDAIEGTITTIRVATMPDGNRYPSLTINSNGDNYDVLASQTQLLRLLAAEKPSAGDKISIKFTRTEKLAGNKTLKHFEVQVTKAEPLSTDELV